MATDESVVCSCDVDASPLNQELLNLVTGKAVPVSTIDFKRKDAMTFVPKTKVNTCYIVMTVIFNDFNQVLLVQEAKESCYGTWYLPAGRLEPNENFVDGAKREVSEEAGLECDITTLLSVHFGCARWMRFSFFGKVTGGLLKTLAEKDKESLQALFHDVSSVLNGKAKLRSNDIIPVIEQGLDYMYSLSSVPLHLELLPVIMGHNLLLHRIVLVADVGRGSRLVMLAGTSGRPHIITSAIAPKDFTLFVTVQAIIREAISEESLVPTIHGILGVEHCGVSGDKDGLCLSTLVSLSVSVEKGLPTLRDEKFAWVPVDDETCIKHIHDGIKGSIVSLIDK